MLILIDNYDSFTYNLVQRFGEAQAGLSMRVHHNDRITIAQLEREIGEAGEPVKIVISPGPCTPNEGGVSNDVIRRFAGEIPILGVCLGHQCIGHSFGMPVVRHDRLMHGKTSAIHHVGRGLYADVPQPFTATRYHSLIIPRDAVTDDFEVTSWTEEGEVMGIRHREMPLEGVQFHPESFLSEYGPVLLRNFLNS